MSAPLLYVTGTNTGVGKTTLSRLLLQRARERNLRVAAMKPFCTGGRDDAEQLQALQTASLTLDELNPFHFIEPVTPYIAARNENHSITLSQTVEAIKKIETKNYPLLIEGAGGLMSPLGDRFTLLDIIKERPGKICVVAPNILGVINSALLTHQALKANEAAAPIFVLMDPAQPDRSSATNSEVIKQWTGATVFEFPFLHQSKSLPVADSISRSVDEILNWAFE
jgi:dethiobiotin synthetase